MIRDPKTGAQMMFERQPMNFDPIEPPPPRHHKIADKLIGAFAVGGLLGAIACWFMERL